jgi:hypothetical protein
LSSLKVLGSKERTKDSQYAISSDAKASSDPFSSLKAVVPFKLIVASQSYDAKNVIS